MQHHEKTVAARLVVSFGDLVLHSLTLGKESISIGRRPYNDVPLDDLTVSGEHAVIVSEAGEWLVKDLNSRNGTIVNGTPVKSRRLQHGDLIEVGIYRLRYLVEAPAAGLDAEASPQPPAMLELLTGPARGEEQRLDRPIVPVTGGANQVAVVSRRASGWYITHLEGTDFPLVNGESIGLDPHPLADQDLVELSGTMFRFHLRAGD